MKYIKKLCAPALIYFIFTLMAIIMDIYYNFFDDLVQKVLGIFVITFLLNLLCKKGYESISWFIIFVPFITLFLIILTIIFIFGSKVPYRI